MRADALPEGWKLIGVDNDMRARFFGVQASIRPNVEQLIARMCGIPPRTFGDSRSLEDPRIVRAGAPGLHHSHGRPAVA